MSRTTKPPEKLFTQVGRIAITSAYIEQEIILWTSALAAQDTGGNPIERLRMDFKRLRKKWYRLASKKLDKKTINKFIHPLNMDLAMLWPIRGAMIHGRWQILGGHRFRVRWWMQETQLVEMQMDCTLKQVRDFASALSRCLKQIYAFHYAKGHASKSYVPQRGNLPRRHTIPKEHRWQRPPSRP